MGRNRHPVSSAQEMARRLLSGRLLMFAALFIWPWSLILAHMRVWYFDSLDPFDCEALTNAGNWVRAAPSGVNHDLEQWQPPGCLIHHYRDEDIWKCLGGKRLVFVGDSTIRQVFSETIRLLDPHLYSNLPDQRHQNIHLKPDNMTIDFIWDPWLNSTDLMREVLNLTGNQSTARPPSNTVALLLIGAPGLWAARHGADEFLSLFEKGMKTVQTLSSDTTEPEDYWQQYRPAMRPPFPGSQVLLAPVQTPLYGALDAQRAISITPERILTMNRHIERTFASPQTFWAYNKMMDGSRSRYTDDGLHAATYIAYQKANLLLNAYCNSKIPANTMAGGTCCVELDKYSTRVISLAKNLSSNYKSLGWPWLAVLVCSLIPLVLRFLMVFLSKSELVPSFYLAGITGNDRKGAKSYFVTTVLLCFLSDKSMLFQRAFLSPDQRSICRTGILWLLASLVSWSKNTERNQPSPRRGKMILSVEQGFLPTPQSNEIKGLMQVLILTYHYHHGSKILWIYKIVRILVSTYFFFSAYGHTMYFLRTGDTSLRRLTTVLFRSNALCFCLTLVMATDYSTYYFVPAINFWFFANWTALRLWNDANRCLGAFAIKMVLAWLVTFILIWGPGVLEMILGLMKVTLFLHFDVHEMRFRLGLESGIIYIGSIVAYLVHGHCREHIIPKSKISTPEPTAKLTRWLETRLLGLMRQGLELPQKSQAMLLMGIIVLFSVFQACFSDKLSYNRAHPFVSWIPILCFLGLRNLTPYMRASHLALPAKVGVLTLEIYLLQYHLWLGNTATARLQIGYFGHYKNPSSASRLAWFWTGLEETTLFASLLMWSFAAHHATSSMTELVSGKR